jgi:formate hydrogenlyase subunit 4
MPLKSLWKIINPLMKLFKWYFKSFVTSNTNISVTNTGPLMAFSATMVVSSENHMNS